MFVSGASCSVVCNCHTHTEEEETAGWATCSAAGMLCGPAQLLAPKMRPRTTARAELSSLGLLSTPSPTTKHVGFVGCDSPLLLSHRRRQIKSRYVSYFSQGLVARHAPQHTTHAPRGATGDWGGRLGRAIDRCLSQGPHAAWYVTATPTQRRRKQQDGPHVLLPAYWAVISVYTGTCPDHSPPSIPPGHKKYKKNRLLCTLGCGCVVSSSPTSPAATNRYIFRHCILHPAYLCFIGTQNKLNVYVGDGCYLCIKIILQHMPEHPNSITQMHTTTHGCIICINPLVK